MNPILEPLTFPDKDERCQSTANVVSSSCECLFCTQVFDIQSSSDQLLAHFLLDHKLVIADVKEIVDIKRFVEKQVSERII